jgi:hypothetical protein
MPRTPRRAAALLLAAATLASLAACAPAEPGGADPTSSPSAEATHAPIFASDEEALAAAVAAYQAYLALSDSITAGGGVSAGRIREVTSEAFGEVSENDFSAFHDAGLRTTGSTTVDSARLVEVDESINEVSIYACQDVSDVRLFNSAGADVTPTDRDNRVPLVISTTVENSKLVVDGNQVWSGDDFC